MTTSISDIRIAPVGEDLTKESLGLSIIRGIEKMFRVDHKLASGVALASGEFGVLQNDGTVVRPGATPVANTYLCFLGSERFDVKATGKVTLIQNSSIIVKTSKYDVSGSYHVGSFLTVKDRGHGEADVTVGAAGEFAVGKVSEVGQGYLVYELIATPFEIQ